MDQIVAGNSRVYVVYRDEESANRALGAVTTGDKDGAVIERPSVESEEACASLHPRIVLERLGPQGVKLSEAPSRVYTNPLGGNLSGPWIFSDIDEVPSEQSDVIEDSEAIGDISGAFSAQNELDRTRDVLDTSSAHLPLLPATATATTISTGAAGTSATARQHPLQNIKTMPTRSTRYSAQNASATTPAQGSASGPASGSSLRTQPVEGRSAIARHTSNSSKTKRGMDTEAAEDGIGSKRQKTDSGNPAVPPP